MCLYLCIHPSCLRLRVISQARGLTRENCRESTFFGFSSPYEEKVTVWNQILFCLQRESNQAACVTLHTTSRPLPHRPECRSVDIIMIMGDELASLSQAKTITTNIVNSSDADVHLRRVLLSLLSLSFGRKTQFPNASSLHPHRFCQIERVDALKFVCYKKINPLLCITIFLLSL